MTISLDSLAGEVDALRALNGRAESDLSPTEFDDFRNGMGMVKRAYDSIAASMAAELVRRSSPELGAGGLARQDGFSNAQQSLGNTLGITPGQAGKFIDAGRALAPKDSPQAHTGTDKPADSPAAPASGPPRYPYIAVALTAGRLSADAAAILTRTLDRILVFYTEEAAELAAARAAAPADTAAAATAAEPHLDAANARELAQLEEQLVAKAGYLSLAELRRVCERQCAWHFPKTLAAKERIRRNNRTLFFHDDPEGMVIMTARMDAASAAPIKAYIDAQTRWALRRRRSIEDGGEGIDDSRRVGQMRLDAMTSLAQHGLGCESSKSGVKTTVVLRVQEQDLRNDLALGECDQISGPITVGTLRAMAVDAGILPVVMGGESLPLDVGRIERLFTPAQRLALAERDGGCSWCHAPPSFCEAHHIEWWARDGGRTDLQNGVLLCTRCHHRVHQDGWNVAVDGDHVWISKPGDPEPRLGGRAHLDLPEIAA